MNPWHIFAWLYTSFNGPFMASVNNIAATVAGEAELPAIPLAAIYIATSFLTDQLTGGSGNPILDLVRRCGRVALIMGCLTSANYTGVISNYLLVTLPNELGTAIVGTGATTGAAAFDALFGSVLAAGAQMLASIASLDIGGYVVLGLATILCDLLCIAGIGIAFVLWIVTQVSLGLLVAIGPLALLCLILPQTSRFFSGWLGNVVTAIAAQIMYVTLITILIATVQDSLHQVLAMNAATGANANKIGNQLHLLLGVGAMYLIAGFLALAIVPLARGIGGGAAAETATIARWAHGQIASVAKAAGGAATGGSSAPAGLAKGGAAGMRSISPVGKAHG